LKEQKLRELEAIDKTLFDFDDSIDNLSEVSERYKLQTKHQMLEPTPMV
jgi:hypothetical protein